MKKVMLTKSQQKSASAPTDVFKTVPNCATTATIINSTSVRLVHVKPNVVTSTYKDRKSFQSIYEEIFKLLLRLPDKALAQRVIDAINERNDKSHISGGNQCKQCSINEQQKCAKKVNVSTQTETLETTELETKSKSSPSEIENADRSELQTSAPNPVPVPATATASTETEVAKADNPPAKAVRKRGRKRNTCVPQVVKRSAAQMALQEREEKQLTPLPASKKKKTVPTTEVQRSDSPMLLRSPQLRRESLTVSDIDLLDLYCHTNDCGKDISQDTIYSTMEKELLGAHIMSEEGLLPIHDAILTGDVQRVQRQLYVWSKLKGNVDLNEVLSADEEDCLQLALTNDCDPEIVDIVLKAGILPNHVYQDSNTALHIAIINNVNLDSVRHLMRRIDLNVLLQTNDDGYTPLHIAVRHNRYRMAEVICNTIDELQQGTPIYKRDNSDSDEDASHDRDGDVKAEKKFAKFYEQVCDHLDANKEKLMANQLKHEILNASEARAGNGCLFYAIEGELEHFCYFFLAHLTNPDEENLSGHSPKSYHYEFARILRINLKISRIMERVHRILNGTAD